MREYEVMFIVDPEIEEEEISQEIEKVKSLITEHGGEVESVDEWGKRQLAYPIRKKREGHYVVINFKGNSTLPQRLRDEIKLDSKILRSMVVRRGE